MNFSSLFPSKYLRAADFPSPRVLEIASVTTETMGDGQSKPILFFRGMRQGLVLNKSNGQTICDLFGDNCDDWTGHLIEAYPTAVDFQGRQVPAIRLREAPQGAATKAAAANAERFDDLDDEIPF